MNIRLILLVFCLAGNALLATAVFHRSSKPARPTTSPEAIISSSSEPTSPNSATTEDTPATASEVDVSNFQWSQFTASDFALYIVQLREFGTPDTQVRDIIYGAVDAIYRPKRKALRPPKKADDGKFWARRNFYGGPDSQMTKEQREQMRALRKEEADLLKSLFGEDFDRQQAQDAGSSNWTEQYYASIPKELREKVQDIDQRMSEAKQEIYAQNGGNFGFDQQADLQKVEKKYHDEMAKILSPEQLFEWDLRHSDTANQLKNDLSAFDPTEDEFRELFKYKQAATELNPPRTPDDDPPQLTPEQRKAVQDQQKALDDELAQALGADRAKEYKLEQDYGYRNLIESGVPKESVFKLDDMKNQVQQAANKIQRDKTLTPEQRSAALSAVRTEAQNSINDLLGEKAAKRYSGNGGWWLNNLSPVIMPR
ncbi:MAG: hypothetical protein WDM76_13695 [Limisphaerales bacterium]